VPKVKGLAFRSVLQAHASIRGEAGLAKVFGCMPPELALTLRAPLASAWYSVENYVGLWEAIQVSTGQTPDYPRLIGRRCVEQDLTVVHKLAFAALTTATVLDISARLFGAYYDTGSCKSVRVDAGTVRVTFAGCVGFSQSMWAELRGAIEAFAEQASKKPVHSTMLQGGLTGHAHCVIDVYW
jgi:hypothetical protein